MKVTTHIKRLVVTAAAGALLLAGSVVPTAQADSGFYTEGTRIRTGPATWYTADGLGYPYHNVTAWGEYLGETIEGNPYWVFHSNWTTDIYGEWSCRYWVNWSYGG